MEDRIQRFEFNSTDHCHHTHKMNLSPSLRVHSDIGRCSSSLQERRRDDNFKMLLTTSYWSDQVERSRKNGEVKLLKMRFSSTGLLILSALKMPIADLTELWVLYRCGEKVGAQWWAK